MRGIQQAVFVWSQSNRGFYPGVVKFAESSGDAFVNETDIERYAGGGQSAGSRVTARWVLLYEGDYFPPEYGLSPGETEPEKLSGFEPGLASGIYTDDDNMASFAMSQLIGNPLGTQTAFGRLREWSDLAGSSAVVISDRLVDGTNTVPLTHTSIWNPQPGLWQGGVAFNDNHVEIFNDSEILTTEYAGTRNNLPDNLFAGRLSGDQNGLNHSNAKQIMRGYGGVTIR